jgi:hypothetical protein
VARRRSSRDSKAARASLGKAPLASQVVSQVVKANRASLANRSSSASRAPVDSQAAQDNKACRDSKACLSKVALQACRLQPAGKGL